MMVKPNTVLLAGLRSGRARRVAAVLGEAFPACRVLIAEVVPEAGARHDIEAQADLVVLDATRSIALDGWLAALRARPRLGRVPRLIMAGRRGDAGPALEDGAVALVVRSPWTPADLVRAVATLAHAGGRAAGAEASVVRLTRLMAMQSAMNRLIVRVPARDVLFREACAIAVRDGGFRFAWLGLVGAGGEVTPAARCGEDRGYIDAIRATADPSHARGLGPTGQALRSGARVVARDFFADELMAPWREAARRAGVRQSVALPLCAAGETIGTLNLYADGDRFDARELATLDELAGDVSFALDNLAREADRAAAREAADLAHERLASVVAASPTLSYTADARDAATAWTWVSANVERVLGHGSAAVLAPGWWRAIVHPDDLARVVAERRQALADGAPLRQEYRVRKADGEVRWILDDLRPAHGEADEPGRVVGAWTDVTAERITAAALRESEERLRLAVAAGHHGLYDVDLATGRTFANDAYALMLGYAPDDFHDSVGAWFARTHPDDLAQVREAFADHRAGRTPYFRCEHRQRTARGDWIWVVSLGLVASRTEDGRPLRVIGTCTDISQMKRDAARLAMHACRAHALAELQHVAEGVSEREFLAHGLERAAALTESSLAALLLVSEDRASLELAAWSPRTPPDRRGVAVGERFPLARLGGAAEAVARGEPRTRGTTSDEGRDAPPVDLPLAGPREPHLVVVPIVEDHRPLVVVVLAGRSRPYADDDVQTVVIVCEAAWRIIDRRRADAARREAAAFNAMLLEQLQQGVVACDVRGRLTHFNRIAREWHALGPDADIASDVSPGRFGLYEEDGATPLAVERAPLVRALRGEHVTNYPCVIRAEGGVAPRWVLSSAGPIIDARGDHRGALLTMRDVTAERAAEAELRLQSAALRAAANAIVITNREGLIEWVNPAFTALTGYEAREVLGKNTREVLRSGMHDRAFYEAMWDTIGEGRVWTGELTNRKKDGALYPEAMSITPVPGDEGRITHYIAIKRDLTEERALQARYLHAQKMESVGRLAGGVAHDFNNVLTIINGILDLTLGTLRPDDPLRPDLEEVRGASGRATTLVRQLLAFTRQQVLHRDAVPVNRLIAELTKMLARLLGDDVVLATALGEDVGSVLLGDGQLEQILVNLAVNARDAMPEGGALHVATSLVERDDAPFVRLVVEDDGVGMDAATQARIFEPFFTTKKPGKGTGLGLPTVYSIVTQAGGTIAVASGPGRGANFVIELPQAEPSQAAPRRAAPTLARADVRHTVLVVEDDPGIRRVAVRILNRAGYSVLAAEGGAAALALLDRYPGVVDLLVTDVAMPGMAGTELAERVAERFPATKVLFTSGFVPDDAPARAAGGAICGVLPKPYTIEDLTRRVKDCLAG